MFSRPFSFNGRIRRTEYGISFIIYHLIYVFIWIAINEKSNNSIFAIIYFPLVWFFLAQGAKRCHDVNKSGWWQIIPFYFLWMLFDPGYPGPNQYDIGYEVYEYGAADYEKPYMVDEQTHDEAQVQ